MNVKEIYEGQQAQELKGKIKKKFEDVRDFVIENKDTIIIATPIVMGVAKPILKSINKHVTIGKAKKLKDLYCYDRSLGHYWSLKRELSNNEWVQVDKRKQAGERLADILADMKVLR